LRSASRELIQGAFAMLLSYDDYGPGPVLVLLHGFPLSRKIWAAQETNVGSMYRVIAPDLRGHGGSAAPEGVYTMDVMAGDVIALLDALQITQPVVLGGLSMGGYVAMALRALYPQRVRALMLMDTRAAADTPEAAQNREELARTVEATGSVRPVVDSMLPRLFSDETRARRAELIPPVRAIMEKTSPRAVAAALRGMARRPDRMAELPSITVPTLVLVGAHDVISPPDEARAMAAALPNAQLAIIPGGGHLAPLENSEAANEAILGFLNKLA
jgi:pimeloyl-ACP methyl ester carboxylesterase